MFVLEEILSLIMKTFLIFSAFKEKPTKTKQSHMHRFFFFFFYPKHHQSSRLSYFQLWCPGEDFLRGAAFETLSILQWFFPWSRPKSFFLWIFAEGLGSDGLVRIHTHWDQVLQSCKVRYVLLSPHLHYLYMHFQNSFHFHKFLLTNIWVQPYGRKEYHKHDIFFLNSNIAVTLQQNGKRKKISLS